MSRGRPPRVRYSRYRRPCKTDWTPSRPRSPIRPYRHLSTARRPLRGTRNTHLPGSPFPDGVAWSGPHVCTRDLLEVILLLRGHVEAAVCFLRDLVRDFQFAPE